MKIITGPTSRRLKVKWVSIRKALRRTLGIQQARGYYDVILCPYYFYDYSPRDISLYLGIDGWTMESVMWNRLHSHLDACISLFIFIAVYDPIVWMSHNLLVLSSVARYLSSLHFWQLWIRNSSFQGLYNRLTKTVYKFPYEKNQ